MGSWVTLQDVDRTSGIITLPLLLGSDPFARFLRFADWLYATTQQTHRIALERLFDLIQQWLTEEMGMNAETTLAALVLDYQASGARGRPKCMAATPSWHA